MGCSLCLQLLLVGVEFLGCPWNTHFLRPHRRMRYWGNLSFCGIKPLSFQGPISLHPAMKTSIFHPAEPALQPFPEIPPHICTFPTSPASGWVSLCSQLSSVAGEVCTALLPPASRTTGQPSRGPSQEGQEGEQEHPGRRSNGLRTKCTQPALCRQRAQVPASAGTALPGVVVPMFMLL